MEFTCPYFFPRTCFIFPQLFLMDLECKCKGSRFCQVLKCIYLAANDSIVAGHQSHFSWGENLDQCWNTSVAWLSARDGLNVSYSINHLSRKIRPWKIQEILSQCACLMPVDTKLKCQSGLHRAPCSHGVNSVPNTVMANLFS